MLWAGISCQYTTAFGIVHAMQAQEHIKFPALAKGNAKHTFPLFFPKNSACKICRTDLWQGIEWKSWENDWQSKTNVEAILHTSSPECRECCSNIWRLGCATFLSLDECARFVTKTCKPQLPLKIGTQAEKLCSKSTDQWLHALLPVTASFLVRTSSFGNVQIDVADQKCSPMEKPIKTARRMNAPRLALNV